MISIKYKKALTTTGIAATSILFLALAGCAPDMHRESSITMAEGAIRLDVEKEFSGGAAGSTTTTVVARYREDNFSSARDVLQMTGLHGSFCIKNNGNVIDISYSEARISFFNNFLFIRDKNRALQEYEVVLHKSESC